MVVNQIIKRAWTRSTLVDQAEEPTGDEVASGLNLLNELLATLNAEPWWPVSQFEVEFDITGQREYTIGDYSVQSANVTNVVASIATMTVDDSSVFSLSTVVPVRLNGSNYDVTVDAINSATEIDVNIGVLPITTGMSGYISHYGIPDIIAYRPKDIDSLKYQTGSTWFNIKQLSLLSWGKRSILENTTGFPYQYRYIPNNPFGKIDFGTNTTGTLQGRIYYKSAVSEVGLWTEMSEILPSEYEANLILLLAAEIQIDNGIVTSGLIDIAANRKRELKVNNVQSTELSSNGGKWYSYKAGRNLTRYQ